MSLLMDALRRAEQVREQGAADQRSEAGAATPEAPVAARLVAQNREEHAGQAQSTEGEGLTLSISEVTPVEPSPAAPTQDSGTVVTEARAVPEVQRREDSVSAPARTIDHGQARRMLALKARQSRRRRFGYLAGGGAALLLAAMVVVYFRVIVETGELRESMPAAMDPVAESSEVADNGPVMAEESVSDSTVATVQAVGASPQSPPDISVATPTRPRAAVRERASTPPARTVTTEVEAAPAPPPLIIVRNQSEDPLQTLLGEAFTAYQKGDDATAELAYRRALQLDARNRDTLLGLAALAQRSGRIDEARQYYRTLLELNPLDSAPVAGLIGLQGGNDPVQDESRIKLLLRQEPEAPYLHFALGTLFVAQARWPEAQQAFFDAYRYDPARADYAFNLAVTLDRLGQRGAAASYYRRALELSRTGVVSFNVADVERRINTLAAAGGGAQ
ncbi:MAG: tetratricopeptide repeat protein [Gammaproteobacteria bacterium]|nr:tetratricopeptide repeat protein [Gammaproteobacteria bacterium]